MFKSIFLPGEFTPTSIPQALWSRLVADPRVNTEYTRFDGQAALPSESMGAAIEVASRLVQDGLLALKKSDGTVTLDQTTCAVMWQIQAFIGQAAIIQALHVTDVECVINEVNAELAEVQKGLEQVLTATSEGIDGIVVKTDPSYREDSGERRRGTDQGAIVDDIPF